MFLKVMVMITIISIIITKVMVIVISTIIGCDDNDHDIILILPIMIIDLISDNHSNDNSEEKSKIQAEMSDYDEVSPSHFPHFHHAFLKTFDCSFSFSESELPFTKGCRLSHFQVCH